MSTTEIVKALVSPAEKLIDAVSGAIGKAYEPRHIRKMAEAKACEIKLIADAVRNNSDVPIVYNTSDVSMDTSNYEEIAKRASLRLAYQEISKQQNIEAVIDNAYEELESSETVSSEPVSADWMTRFFSSVEDISDDEMQKIWGHILAGEIKAPHTYSFRTLEKMRNLTQQEAAVFQRVAALALKSSGKAFILTDEALLDNQDIYFIDILCLEEAGLMVAKELSITINFSSSETLYIYNATNIGVLRRKKDNTSHEIKLDIFVFTESGRQLLTAIRPKACQQYFLDCMQKIHNQYGDFTVTAHAINYMDVAGKVNYNPVDLLSAK